MSQLKTNSITHVDNTGDPNITLGADGSVNVAALNGGQLAGFRNQIINGNMEIWQRGTTRTYQDAIDVVFSADRWANYRANSGGTCTTTRINISDLPGFSAGLQMTGSGVGYTQACYQPIELNPNGIVPFGEGQTWTLSCYIKGSAAGSTELFAQFNTSSNLIEGLQGVESNTVEFTTSWQRFSLTFVIPEVSETRNALNVGVYDADGTASTNVQVTGFQLEPGPVATPFEHRFIGTELALCQRYYVAGEAYIRAAPQGSTRNGCSVFFPAFMRAVPTNGASTKAGFGNTLAIDYVTNSSMVGTGVPNAVGELFFSYNADAEL